MPLQDFRPKGEDGQRRAQTAQEQALVQHLRTVKVWSAIDVRGTLFTTQQEANKRSHDNSGAMFPFVNNSGVQKINYGTIQEILVCKLPGHNPQPVAVMLWHEMKDAKFCKGKMPHLERGKPQSKMNRLHSCEWFEVAFAQNVAFLPKDARTPKNDQLLAVTRFTDYNPLHNI